MTKLEISQNQLDEWKKDPQTGKPNPKSISEAMSMKQAIENGLYKNAMRPDLKKGEPNLDFKVIQNDGRTGWLDYLRRWTVDRGPMSGPGVSGPRLRR